MLRSDPNCLDTLGCGSLLEEARFAPRWEAAVCTALEVVDGAKRGIPNSISLAISMLLQKWMIVVMSLTPRAKLSGFGSVALKWNISRLPF